MDSLLPDLKLNSKPLLIPHQEKPSIKPLPIPHQEKPSIKPLILEETPEDISLIRLKYFLNKKRHFYGTYIRTLEAPGYIHGLAQYSQIVKETIDGEIIITAIDVIISFTYRKVIKETDIFKSFDQYNPLVVSFKEGSVIDDFVKPKINMKKFFKYCKGDIVNVSFLCGTPTEEDLCKEDSVLKLLFP